MTVPSSGVSFSIAPGAKVAEITADSDSAVTHDTAISINIESASFSKEFFQDEVRADGRVLDKYSEFDKISGSFTLAKMDLETLAMITGNTLVTTENDKYLDFDADNFPNYFALGFKSTYHPTSDIGDKHYILHKCKITGVDMGGGDRQYNKPVVNFEAIPREYDGKVSQIRFHETATAVSFVDLPVT